MRAALRGKPLPANLGEANALFVKTFKKIVGVDLPDPGKTPDPASLYLKKFATGTGMSDGQVSLLFWRDTAFPILLDRFAAAIEVEDVSDRIGDRFGF